MSDCKCNKENRYEELNHFLLTVIRDPAKHKMIYYFILNILSKEMPGGGDVAMKLQKQQ